MKRHNFSECPQNFNGEIQIGHPACPFAPDKGQFTRKQTERSFWGLLIEEEAFYFDQPLVR